MSRLELPYPEQAVWERRFGNFDPEELAAKVEPFTTAGDGEVSPISADIAFGLMGDHGYFPGLARIRAMSGSRHIAVAPAFDAAHRPPWWDRFRLALSTSHCRILVDQSAGICMTYQLWVKSSSAMLLLKKTRSHSLMSKREPGWWFQFFFIFTPVWGNDPNWLIFLRWVETTN